MIGAEPNTEWLGGCVALDSKGFVLTGTQAGAASAYETERAGIFAVGDVRSGSVKRVAAGVGEGSVAVQAIHHYLQDLGHSDRDGASTILERQIHHIKIRTVRGRPAVRGGSGGPWPATAATGSA
jgi:pyruvate/2-oxoglutarate dehydrogenase complex dihydrolipoamide dehydrogenase (E3) component